MRSMDAQEQARSMWRRPSGALCLLLPLSIVAGALAGVVVRGWDTYGCPNSVLVSCGWARAASVMLPLANWWLGLSLGLVAWVTALYVNRWAGSRAFRLLVAAYLGVAGVICVFCTSELALERHRTSLREERDRYVTEILVGTAGRTAEHDFRSGKLRLYEVCGLSGKLHSGESAQAGPFEISPYPVTEEFRAQAEQFVTTYNRAMRDMYANSKATDRREQRDDGNARDNAMHSDGDSAAPYPRR